MVLYWTYFGLLINRLAFVDEHVVWTEIWPKVHFFFDSNLFETLCPSSSLGEAKPNVCAEFSKVSEVTWVGVGLHNISF